MDVNSNSSGETSDKSTGHELYLEVQSDSEMKCKTLESGVFSNSSRNDFSKMQIDSYCKIDSKSSENWETNSQSCTNPPTDLSESFCNKSDYNAEDSSLSNGSRSQDISNQINPAADLHGTSQDELKSQTGTIGENNDIIDEPVFAIPLLPTKISRKSVSEKKNLAVPSQKEIVPSSLDETTTESLNPDKKKVTKLLEKYPAEKLAKLSASPLHYKEPSWGGTPPSNVYRLEVLKNGVIIDNIALSKNFTLVGRSETCDINMEHPSISRHHCIIQYCSVSGSNINEGKRSNIKSDMDPNINEGNHDNSISEGNKDPDVDGSDKEVHNSKSEAVVSSNINKKDTTINEIIKDRNVSENLRDLYVSEKGMYIYELGSTHRTSLNKHILKPRVFVRLRVGHMLKFGGSTRLFIVHGPTNEEEDEMTETVTELMQAAEQRKIKLDKVLSKLNSKEVKQQPGESHSNKNESGGISWGMAEDAVEENSEDDDDDDENYVNPYSQADEELQLEDPKKSLRGWFEREGHDLPNYIVEEITNGFFRAKVELPLPDVGRRGVVCSIEHKGKKKDAVVQCALEACRILDKRQLLRQAKHKSHSKKIERTLDEDFYGSDDDEFLDRTGDIENKRRKAKKELSCNKEILTYDILLEDYVKVCSELERLENNLLESDRKIQDCPDELEDFMGLVESDGVPVDRHKRIEWRLECTKLNKEEGRLLELLNVARPVGMEVFLHRKSLLKSKSASSSNTKIFSTEKSKLFKRFLPNEPKINSKPRSQAVGVHKSFLEEEIEYKPKLSKVDCNDDTDNIKPVPYSTDIPTRKLKKTAQRTRGKIGPFNPYHDPADLGKPLKPLSTREHVTSMSISSKDDPNSSISSNNLNTDTAENLELSHTQLIEKPITDSNLTENLESTDLVQTNLEKEVFSTDKCEETCGDSEPKIESEFKSPQLPLKDGMKRKIIGPSLLKDNFQVIKNLSNKKKKMKKCDWEQGDEWVPPVNQSGDGKTHLNDKFGY